MIVVGGGISGLATCYYLQDIAKKTGKNIHPTLIEAGTRLGGKIHTDHIDGLVIEAGPDSFFTQKSWALDLCKELGLSDRLVPADQNNKGTYILNRNKLSKLPQGTETGMPTKLVPFLGTDLISTAGKLRALMDFVIPGRKDKEDESVAAFFSRRFGKEFLEKIAEPLFAGIYAGDVNELGMRAVFPRLAELESAHGSLIRSMMSARKKMQSSNSSPAPNFFTLKGGLGGLIDSIVSRLDNSTIMLNSRVAKLSAPASPNGRSPGVVLDNGKELIPGAVVLATPAYVTEKLVRDIDQQSADLLATIPYVSTATVSMAFKGSALDKKLDGHGFLVPRKENEIVTGCTWTSAKWPSHVTTGTLLVRCFVGWAGHEDFLQMDDNTLVERIREFLKRVADISSQPALTRVYRWKQALPQYNVGHVERIAKLEEALGKVNGLYVTGAAYRGVGLPDCVHEAALTAQKIVKVQAEKSDV